MFINSGIRLYVQCLVINPRRMREAYGSWFVCVCACVYLSVTVLTATYIILKSKVRYHRGLHGVLNICNVWLSLKRLMFLT